MIAAYAAAIGGHLYIEYAFARSTLHNERPTLDRIPGIYMVDNEQARYCVDDAVEGRAIGPSVWYERNCESGPAQRVTVMSDFLRKYWVHYITAEGEVAFKRSWTVM